MGEALGWSAAVRILLQGSCSTRKSVHRVLAWLLAVQSCRGVVEGGEMPVWMAALTGSAMQRGCMAWCYLARRLGLL